jgi:hypothetical protein
MAFVIREDGSKERTASEECPRCSNMHIESSTDPTPNFDETGWHYATRFTCLNTKCRHVWQEKIVVQPGGFSIRGNSSTR